MKPWTEAKNNNLLFIYKYMKSHSKLTYLLSFLPKASFGLRVLSLPACFRVSVNHELVCVITRHKFELESPNLYKKKCKIFCLRSLLFLGLMRLDFPGQILLYWKILLICIAFASLKYLWVMSVELFHIPHGSAHIVWLLHARWQGHAIDCETV